MNAFPQEFYDKAVGEQKGKLQIVISDSPIYVIALAINKDKSKNLINKINCRKGIPLGGYVYDSHLEVYYYECCDYIHLGIVPVCASLKIKSYDFWEMKVPVAENVLRKFLNIVQKKDLKIFQTHFKSDQFDLQFLQMIYANG